MPDLYDCHDKAVVPDGVDYPVISLPNAISFVG
jgi:hypothetical protein